MFMHDIQYANIILLAIDLTNHLLKPSLTANQRQLTQMEANPMIRSSPAKLK